MLSKYSGEFIIGMVVITLVTTIPFLACRAGFDTDRDLSIPTELLLSGGRAVACIPVPDCRKLKVTFELEGHRLGSRLVDTAQIREQRVALYEILSPVEAESWVDIKIAASDLRGDFCVDTGPLTGLCNRTLLGYAVAPAAGTIDGTGTVTRCEDLNDCRSAKADILLITGHHLYNDPYVDSLAGLWAERMGLNTAIVDVASISTYSPIQIRDFIKDLYNTTTAEHYGDGRLGFVVLLGDAYENDNLTPMLPEYDGYGGDASASDHFYACIAGSDDFEDVMIGRIPAGTQQELAGYYHKLASYTPLPTEAWTKSWLFAGGCFLAQKEDYIIYFDSLEAYVPDDIKVSRLYRYDFPSTDEGDAQACQAMLDSLAAGKLFLLYSGDGDKWDWGGRYERSFRSEFIDDLDNADRLPIVLSISCSNGWFDNVTQPYKDGGYDCFAERLLNQPDCGAVACLASSREAGGNASTLLAPEIVKSAYVNGSTFLGELILEAKTRHLAKLGPVILARQFNLFGDPCLNYDLNDLPLAAPDLLIRPYSVGTECDFPLAGNPLEIKFEIWNGSGVPVDRFSVTLYSGHPDSGGTVIDTCECWDFWGWEKRQMSFVVEGLPAGRHSLSIEVDGGGEIQELDESNNLVTLAAYVYPFQSGYPVKLADDIKGIVIADLDSNGSLDILVTSGGTHAAAVNLDGSLLWVKEDMGLPQVFGGIEPSAFDLNGDGATEAILTTKSGILVVEGLNGSPIWQRYTEYPVLSPIVADLDADGSFEIVMGTYDYMFSRIYAFSPSGAYSWTHDLDVYKEKLTGMVVCDYDIDSYKEIIFSTDDGDVTCLVCTSSPPSTQWDEHISDASISCLAAGDLDRDGSIEVIAVGGTTVYILNTSDGSVEDTIELPVSVEKIAIGNLDSDIDLEIVCTSETGRIVAIDGDVVTVDVVTEFTPIGSPVVADIDQDGASEVILALEEGRVRILAPTGEDFIAPIPTKGLCRSGPVTQDLDLDGNIEILAGSSDSLLFVLDMGIGGGRVDWLCSGATCSRSGLYAQPVFGNITGNIALSGRLDAVGDILVDTTGTLTLERGVDLRFVCDDVYRAGTSSDMCEIQVAGSLIAVGGPTSYVNLSPLEWPGDRDDWMGILLEAGASATLTRTEIRGAVTGIECMTSDATISECLIKECTIGIKVTAAAPLIDHNEVMLNNYGISTNQGPAVIVGNHVTENLYAGVTLSTSSNAVLEDNVIGYTTQGHGISCYSSSPSILGGNRIRGNSQCGIYLSNSSPTVDSCWIAFNTDCGIKAAYFSNPVVAKTTIAENRIGVAVYVYANPVLGDTVSMSGGDNDIRQNSQYALYNTTSNSIKAQMTWWGSDPPDPEAFLGKVDYSGWLSLPPAGIEDVREPGWGIRLHPNPFSHSVVMSLSVDQTQLPADLSVYDVRGRLVRRLPPVTESGEGIVEWNGTDNFGNPVASGTYYLAVRTRKELYTSKLLYVR
jgi:parallel beta-helix repeat protein